MLLENPKPSLLSSTGCLCVLTLCCFLSLQLHMRIHAAYGSTKDISVYSSISLPPTHIYIVGRPTKKLQSQCQVGATLAEPWRCCQGPLMGGRWEFGHHKTGN